MSSILYYSNFCEYSKKLLQTVSKTQLSKDIHFICIDNRIKEGGKIYIVLQNNQKIIMPENVTKVPALLLLNQNYKVLYGDDIHQFIKPKQTAEIKQATQNNMEPMAFSFGSGFGTSSGGSGIASDTYSFLDMNDTDLGTKGNGGLRQMHNYVSLHDSSTAMNLPDDDKFKENSKGKGDNMSLEALQKQREQDMSKITYNK